MKRNAKQRLALCLTASLLLGMLPVGNTVSSQAADTSVAAEEDAVQVTAQNTAQTDYGLKNPRTDNGVTTWDCITFGNYWQNDTDGNGKANQEDDKEPIVWRVLSVDGNDAFLLADKNLDYTKYHNILEATNVTWETCRMRSWLNGYGDYSDNSFLKNAFNESEQAAIIATTIENKNNPSPSYNTEGGNDTTDRVYLLSFDEVLNPSYGFRDHTGTTETRVVKNTAYVERMKEFTSDWWLRTPGAKSSYACYVDYDDGYIFNYGTSVSGTWLAVRPALHLDLSFTENWSPAGTVTARDNIATPSPTPTAKPTATPTVKPTVTPTTTPSPTPTVKPTVSPSSSPSSTPTVKPTASPTSSPSTTPTVKPTASPSSSPSTTPTATPTAKPTAKPTASPSGSPTAKPSTSPSSIPSSTPTVKPTVSPSSSPSPTPTAKPSAKPTASPSGSPTAKPSALPTVKPSTSPSASPSSTPAWLIPEVTYDAAEFEAFAGRTKEEAVQRYIEARYAAQSYDETDHASFYKEQPSFTAPYYPGLLSDGTLGTMLAFCNYYRWLAGQASVNGTTTQEDVGYGSWCKQQQWAFIWSFGSSKPEDFPEDKWEKLSTTYYHYIIGDTPLEAIKNLMNRRLSWESNPFETYEGRDYILSPLTKYISMGFSGNRLVLGGNTDGGKKDAPFYAFPSEGYMPNDLLSADGAAWNVVLNYGNIRIPEPKDVCVTIVHRESGEKFVRKAVKNGDATAAGTQIIFEGPASENMSVYTGTYDVEITGLLDVATGKGAKICYTVNFFDGAECLKDTEVKEVSSSSITKFVVPQQMASKENLEKLAAVLPREMTVTGENGRKVLLPVKGNWVYDAAGSCWKNSIDVAKLPSGMTDMSGRLSNCTIACEVGDNRGLTFEMFWYRSIDELIPGCPTDGQGGKITIKWNETSKIDHAVLYQITENEQGYTASVSYDPETAWHGNESEVENAFVFQAAYFIENSGDYVAVGYVDGEKTAYVSGNIQTLLVTERRTDFGSQTGNTGGGNSGGSGTDIGTGTGGSSNAGGTGSMTGTGSTTDDNDSEDDSDEDIETDNTDEDSTALKIAKVKNLKVKAKKKSAVLTWKKMSGVSGYQICYSTSKKWKGGKNKSSKKNKVTIKGLKKKKTYYFRVRAYAKVDGKTVYGNWSKKMSIKVKK